MGLLQSSTSSQSLTESLSKKWVKAIENQETAIFQYTNPHRSQLLINQQTQQLIEEYQLAFATSKDYEAYLQTFQWRRTTQQGRGCPQCPEVYGLRFFKDYSSKQFCATLYGGSVYADKVDLTLNDITDIPIQDSIYLLRAAARGFEFLCRRYGCFDVVEQMIFIDQEGKVKVWMHPNLSNNYPVCHAKFQVDSQSAMIKRLLALVEANTDYNDEVISFIQFIRSQYHMDRLSFSTVFDALDSYCSQHQIAASSCMESIKLTFESNPVQQVYSPRPFYQFDTRTSQNRTEHQFGKPELSKKLSDRIAQDKGHHHSEKELPVPSNQSISRPISIWYNNQIQLGKSPLMSSTDFIGNRAIINRPVSAIRMVYSNPISTPVINSDTVIPSRLHAFMNDEKPNTSRNSVYNSNPNKEPSQQKVSNHHANNGVIKLINQNLYSPPNGPFSLSNSKPNLYRQQTARTPKQSHKIHFSFMNSVAGSNELLTPPRKSSSSMSVSKDNEYKASIIKANIPVKQTHLNSQLQSDKAQNTLNRQPCINIGSSNTIMYQPPNNGYPIVVRGIPNNTPDNTALNRVDKLSRHSSNSSYYACQTTKGPVSPLYQQKPVGNAYTNLHYYTAGSQIRPIDSEISQDVNRLLKLN